MFARAAAAPCAAAQFARARRETGRLARGSRSRAKSGRRASPSGVDVTPRAVSISDKVRGEDEPPSTVPDPASVPDQVTTSTSPAEAPAAPRRARPTVRAGAPVVAPRVISSKAAMLASAEDLAGDCDADADDKSGFDREADREADLNDGIVSWTVKYVDKALDDIEREKPAAADVAWRLNKAGERVASNPTVRRGAKLTADVGMEVLKVGVKAAAPVVGNIGKFAAKQAFGAAVSGFKNPLDELKRPNAEKSEARASSTSPNGEKKKKKIVKLTAAEAEALRKAGKTVRKVEKKKGGFFGM
jgi:hypothetical protein